jgi:alkanesulfonate monooxygenase SsuD/methylene tetrahydromethanopterin reductase-like flavin-dependent oxidoreductase (luciferase family)
MTTHPIQFGFCIPIFAWPGGRLFRTPNYAELDVSSALGLAQLADSLGYDSLWVADHLMLGKDQAIMEGWTTLAALAGSTEHAKLGIIHQAHFFRIPSIAAKMIATLDQISGGRFIYFIDTGTQPTEHKAYGLTYPDTAEERMAYLLEGLELAKTLWSSDQPVTFDGDYYHVTDAICNPKPVSQPHPPIWFGEAHPATLAACARHGQGWNSVPVKIEQLRQRLVALGDACQSVGRDVAEIEKSLEIQILIAPDHAAIRQKLRDMLALTPDGVATADDPALLAFVAGDTDDIPPALTDTWLIGTPDEVEQQLRQYIDLGFTHFMLWFVDAPDDDGLRLFSEQVAPAFRSA